ncbi:MAG TPA: cupin domain-containing protein [Hyphomicrobiaceae bacterium]|nr:cupin domain-containing protein [Hyphomicrobiaceae bacterium]
MTRPARPAAKPTQFVDNERAIVTEWRFAPGAETGWHRHGHDYVVVPMTNGELLLEEPGGTSRTAPLTAGVPYFKSEGVEHNVVNASSHEVVFVEIEFKRKA